EGGGVMFGSLGPKDTPGTAGVYVVTADPDSVHERAVEAGATVRHAPYETDHGSRNVTLLDPEGNSWTFGTYAGAAATSSTGPRTGHPVLGGGLQRPARREASPGTGSAGSLPIATILLSRST